MGQADPSRPAMTTASHLPRGDFALNARLLRITVMAIVVGAVSTVAARVLLDLIRFFTNLFFFQAFSLADRSPAGHTLGAWVIAVPVIGGLIVGLIARYGSDKIRGHGIPEAIEAILFGKSKMSPKVALLKPLSSGIVIGSGGPFGAEGPIIMTGGAIGSLIAQHFHLTAAERKALLVAGATAGMTAVFGTPVAAVLLAVELLLFELRPRSLLPVAVACAVAGFTRPLLMDPGPLFPLQTAVPGPLAMLSCLAAGLLCGALSASLSISLYKVEDLFGKLPIHWMWWPAIGGTAVGVIGWFDPRTLGVGYDNLRILLDGNMAVKTIAVLAVLKFVSWWIALGSGTSGGTLAPLMTVGGAAGALCAHALHGVPLLGDFPIGLGVLIGMAATFAGASRAFLASVAFAFEATHAVASFGPLLLGCGAAVLVSRLLMKETIMTEKLARRGVRIPSDYEPDPLRGMAVSSLMIREPLVIDGSMTVTVLADLISGNAPRWNRARLFPIIGEDRSLLGVVSRADILAALQSSPEASVLDAGTVHPITIHPDETLAEAADRMIVHEIGRLPVVDRANPPVLLGIISRREILEAKRRRLEDEGVRG